MALDALLVLLIYYYKAIRQAPLSMGFSRQEYWSGLPCPPPGDLPDPETELASLTSPALAGGFFTPGDTREALQIKILEFISFLKNSL